MDTVELLKTAWEAVVKSGVPAEVQGIALKAAIDDIRGSSPLAPGDTTPASDRKPTTRRAAPASPTSSPRNGGSKAILNDVGDGNSFFAAIARETGVVEQDLRDVFHVESGTVELKVPAKSLGANNTAKTVTIAALLGGAVFAGTSHSRLPFKDIHAVCKAKKCYDRANGSTNIKATPGFAAVGSGTLQALTHKSGWETEFANAVSRALGKTDEG
jgi:uncharacterized membrane protein